MSDYYHSFEDYFRSCCLNACTRMAYRKNRKNPRYLRAQRECEALYRRIGQRLGADAQLIDRYDAAKVHVMTFDDEHIYHQGFLDCIYLLRWLGLL